MNSKSALTLLNRLANRQPGQVVLLERAFRRRLDQLAEIILKVAVETEDPAGNVMAARVQEEGLSRDTVKRVLDKLSSEVYRSSVPLREIGLAATRTALEQWQDPDSHSWTT